MFANSILMSIFTKHMYLIPMTSLGEYLNKKSIHKAEVSRKTGIRKSRLSQLSNDEKSNLKAKELFLISKAIGANPNEFLEKLYGYLKLEI